MSALPKESSNYVVRIDGVEVGMSEEWDRANEILEAARKSRINRCASIVGRGRAEFFRLQPVSTDAGTIALEWRTI